MGRCCRSCGRLPPGGSPSTCSAPRRPPSTWATILDGGILIARLPKGILGEDATRLVGSLLLTGLWQAATTRTSVPENARLDATVVVDECHNFLHLPIGLDDALAEARSYRMSWVLAHQHLGQLPPAMAAAVDANARNKICFTLAPADARVMARHRPDLSTLATPSRPARHARRPRRGAGRPARQHGLPQHVRAEHAARRRHLVSGVATGAAGMPGLAGPVGGGRVRGSLAASPAHSLPHSPARKQWAGERATPASADPQVNPRTDKEGRVPD